MPVSVSAADLTRALKLLKPIAKGFKPILRCVHLRAGNGRLVVTATDLETASEHRLEAEGEIETCVDLRALLDIIQAAEGRLTLRFDEARLYVEHGSGHASLPTHEPSDFPTLGDPASIARLEAPGLQLALERTLPFAGKRTRYACELIRIRLEQGQLGLEATDGRRLALASAPASGSPFMALAHQQSLKHLLAHLKRHKPRHIEIRRDGTTLAFRAPDFTLYAAEVDAEFPPVERVLPSGSPAARLEVDPKDLGRALKGLKAETVRLHVDGNFLTVTAYTTETGETVTHLPAGGAGNFEVTLDTKLLRDIITPAKGRPLHIHYFEPEKPLDIRLEDDSDFRYVLMPVTL